MEKHDYVGCDKLISIFETDSIDHLLAGLDSFELPEDKTKDAKEKIHKIYKESKKPVVELTLNFNIENKELFLRNIKINETLKKIKKEEAAAEIEEEKSGIKAAKNMKRKR